MDGVTAVRILCPTTGRKNGCALSMLILRNSRGRTSRETCMRKAAGCRRWVQVWWPSWTINFRTDRWSSHRNGQNPLQMYPNSNASSSSFGKIEKWINSLQSSRVERAQLGVVWDEQKSMIIAVFCFVFISSRIQCQIDGRRTGRQTAHERLVRYDAVDSSQIYSFSFLDFCAGGKDIAWLSSSGIFELLVMSPCRLARSPSPSKHRALTGYFPINRASFSFRSCIFTEDFCLGTWESWNGRDSR